MENIEFGCAMKLLRFAGNRETHFFLTPAERVSVAFYHFTYTLYNQDGSFFFFTHAVWN